MNSDQMKFTAAFALVALWAAFVFMKMASPDALLDFIKVTVGAIAGHWTASSSNSQAASPMLAVPPGKSVEGGWTSMRVLIVLAALALGLAMLGGCTTTTASMYRGYTADAVAGVKMWDDNTLATVQTVLCAQPYSAIQRHPELQPGVQALCGPLANSSSLDANQLAMLMQLLNASGVKLRAAPTNGEAK